MESLDNYLVAGNVSLIEKYHHSTFIKNKIHFFEA